MGRAVMVGRGPTGAGVLVLSILINLTTEGCRAQKGWWHTAEATTGGAECGCGGDVRPCWSKSVNAEVVDVFFFRDKPRRRYTVYCVPNLKPTLHGRVYVEFCSVYTACRRPSWCVWLKKGVVKPGKPVLKKLLTLWTISCCLAEQLLAELTCGFKVFVWSLKSQPAACVHFAIS